MEITFRDGRSRRHNEEGILTHIDDVPVDMPTTASESKGEAGIKAEDKDRVEVRPEVKIKKFKSAE